MSERIHFGEMMKSFFMRRWFWFKDFLGGGNMWRHYRDVRRIMLHPEKLQPVLEKRLGDILQYAKSHTGYYSGFEGKVLSDFPVVDKNTIREDYDAFIVGSKDGYTPRVTSGSTGTMFRAYQDKDSAIRRIATIKASNEEFGFHSCMPMLYLRTLEIPEKDGSMLRYEKAQNIWFGYIASYSDAELERVVRFILDRHIRFVKGYASVIEHLTDFVERTGTALPRGLVFITISEILTENVRSRIVDRLGLHVVSQYANEENGLMGQSVPDGPGNVFRLNRANCRIELLDLDSDEPVSMGQPGRVVVTDMTNRAMPMIRYDIGDVAVCLEALPDGEPSVIRLLDCRRNDMIYDTSGNPASMVFPPQVIALPSLRQLQFIQEDVKEYVLNLNLASDSQNVDCGKVAQYIKDLLGQDATVHVNILDEMPQTSARKHKLCIQRCPRYQGS